MEIALRRLKYRLDMSLRLCQYYNCEYSIINRIPSLCDVYVEIIHYIEVLHRIKG